MCYHSSEFTTTQSCMIQLMTLAHGITAAGPCMTLFTIDHLNHTLAVAHHGGSGIDTSTSVGLSDPSGIPSRAPNNDKLPIELLVYIFTLASTASPSIFDVDNQALWNGRLVLAAIIAVCRLWRNAALGAQSLWSIIVLPSGSKHIQKCLEASLYHSKSSAIDIFFFRFPGRPVYKNDSHKAREHDMILNLLSHNDVSPRVRVLSNLPVGSITLGDQLGQHGIENLLRNTGRMIEAVGILHWGHTDHSQSSLALPTTIEILECLPVNVRQLSLQPPSWHANGMTELLESPSTKSLWGRLSCLNIVGPQCIYLMDITSTFRECTALEEAQFSRVLGVFFAGEIDGYGPMFGRDRLNLPHLRQLVIQKFDGDATWLLDAISCPTMVNLAVNQQFTISRQDLDHDAAMRWESFIQRTFSISTSPRDVLHEIWVHGLPKESIDYILSSREVKGVRSIALALSSNTLNLPGYAQWFDRHTPLAPQLNMETVYNQATEEYGLPVNNTMQEYEPVSWYGWDHSRAPLHLSGFAVQCLQKITVCVDGPTHFDLD